MLAVVVLVPIALMILAVSLERFEAVATRVAPAPRAPRGTAPTPADTAPPLRLVPSAGTDAAEPAADEYLRRAS
jgi:hypothetical protein